MVKSIGTKAKSRDCTTKSVTDEHLEVNNVLVDKNVNTKSKIKKIEKIDKKLKKLTIEYNTEFDVDNSGKHDDEVKMLCVCCGVDMGSMNMRQYCKKWYCPMMLKYKKE